MKPFEHITYDTVSDVGCKRKTNEDASVVIPEHGFFCVADGMGGEDDGEIASGALVQAFLNRFKEFDPEKPLALRSKTAWITKTVDEVSNSIFQRSRELYGKPGMGTTLVGVTFDPSSPTIALALHAGDSRIYHWTRATEAASCEADDRNNNPSVAEPGGRLTLVTVDHSVANSFDEQQKRRLDPATLNMIMRAVGLAPSVQVELTPFTVTAGDYVLACSDGLTKMVAEAKIASILASSSAPSAAARELVEAALAAGGKDNVTVIVLKIGVLPVPLPEGELNQDLPPAGEDFTIDQTPSPETAGTQDTLPIHAASVAPAFRARLLAITIGTLIVAVVLAAVTYGIITFVSSPPAPAQSAGAVAESPVQNPTSAQKVSESYKRRVPANHHQDRDDYFKQ
jgi:protein phosphatase